MRNLSYRVVETWGRQGRSPKEKSMARELGPRYRVSNSNSAWHPPQTVMPDRLQIQFL